MNKMDKLINYISTCPQICRTEFIRLIWFNPWLYHFHFAVFIVNFKCALSNIKSFLEVGTNNLVRLSLKYKCFYCHGSPFLNWWREREKPECGALLSQLGSHIQMTIKLVYRVCSMFIFVFPSKNFPFSRY